MDFDQEAYENEKKVWVFTTGSGSSWSKPNYQGWEFINDGKPATQQEADQEVWECRCESNTSGGEMEMCDNCGGDGCEDCDYEGGWEEDWSEVVERNTYCYLEEYDPKVHFQVPSDREEYHMWQANKTLDFHERRVRYLGTQIDQLREQLEELERTKALEETKVIDAQVHLQKTKERFA